MTTINNLNQVFNKFYKLAHTAETPDLYINKGEEGYIDLADNNSDKKHDIMEYLYILKMQNKYKMPDKDTLVDIRTVFAENNSKLIELVKQVGLTPILRILKEDRLRKEGLDVYLEDNSIVAALELFRGVFINDRSNFKKYQNDLLEFIDNIDSSSRGVIYSKVFPKMVFYMKKNYRHFHQAMQILMKIEKTMKENKIDGYARAKFFEEIIPAATKLELNNFDFVNKGLIEIIEKSNNVSVVDSLSASKKLLFKNKVYFLIFVELADKVRGAEYCFLLKYTVPEYQKYLDTYQRLQEFKDLIIKVRKKTGLEAYAIFRDYLPRQVGRVKSFEDLKNLLKKIINKH